MSKAVLEPELIAATLLHSRVFNIVVEGRDDRFAYRRLPELLPVGDGAIVPTGGRTALLRVFEIVAASAVEARCCFIADQDLWALDGIPERYLHPQLIFTSGASLENDLCLDYDYLRLMSTDEITSFEREMNAFLPWYAAASKGLTLPTLPASSHPQLILSSDIVHTHVAQLRAQGNFPVATEQIMRGEPLRLIRGKSIFDLLLRQLSRPERASKFSRQNLFEIGAAHGGPNMARLRDEVLERYRSSC